MIFGQNYISKVIFPSHRISIISMDLEVYLSHNQWEVRYLLKKTKKKELAVTQILHWTLKTEGP